MNWPSKGEAVEVEWVDSATTAGWQDEFDGDGLVQCRTAGYLYSKDRRSVKVVQSQTSHGLQSEMIAIPRTCVRRITRLIRKRKAD